MGLADDDDDDDVDDGMVSKPPLAPLPSGSRSHESRYSDQFQSSPHSCMGWGGRLDRQPVGALTSWPAWALGAGRRDTHGSSPVPEFVAAPYNTHNHARTFNLEQGWHMNRGGPPPPSCVVAPARRPRLLEPAEGERSSDSASPSSSSRRRGAVTCRRFRCSMPMTPACAAGKKIGGVNWAGARQ